MKRNDPSFTAFSFPIAACAVALVLQGLSAPAVGQSIVLNAEEEPVFEKFNWIPYAFFSESFGLGFGVGAGYTGWPQEQASLLGAVTLGTKGSYNVAVALNDYQVPGLPRLVVQPLFVGGKYQDQRLFVGRNPDFGGERAGSNNSDPDHYVEATQWDNRIRLEFLYLLPWGHGRDQIVSRYVLQRGLLIRGASGGDFWNPLESGRTRLSLTPTWREQTLSNDELEVPFSTFNVELALDYDNYDFPFNPSRGSSQRVAYQRDFEDDEYFGDWEAWFFEADKVFNLGANDRWSQRVLALRLWTAYVPTWESETVDGLEVVTRRPPHFEGATLGGIYRMRAYEDDRFQDKAAIYYSAELRAMPNWQPLKQMAWLDWAEIGWWQWTLFAEAGQVSPHYNLSDLHSDLHVDGGISVRAMIHKAVCRLDFAYGEEGGRVVAMYGHPF